MYDAALARADGGAGLGWYYGAGGLKERERERKGDHVRSFDARDGGGRGGLWVHARDTRERDGGSHEQGMQESAHPSSRRE